MIELKTENEKQSFIDKFDTFLFDCDGVIWQGTLLIPNVKHTLSYLRSLSKTLIFVTNNSTKSRSEYVDKFKSFGIDVKKEEIYGSSYCAAYYLKTRLNTHSDTTQSGAVGAVGVTRDTIGAVGDAVGATRDTIGAVGATTGSTTHGATNGTTNGTKKRVYVVGMNGIVKELESVGIECTGSSLDNQNITDLSQMSTIQPDPNISAVLVGFDLNINYLKLSKAFCSLKDPNCLFLATNSDSTFPTPSGVYPGTGTIVSALERCTGRKAIVLGKPSQTMLDCIVEDYHLNRDRCCMVGDRLDTDIAFGKMGGMSTLLVFSGVTGREDVGSVEPDYLLETLGHLVPFSE